MMKKEIERNKFGFRTKAMLAGMILMPLSVVLMSPRFLGIKGVFLPLLIGIVTFIQAIQIEQIKKKNNLRTYADILAYMEGKAIDSEVQKKQNHVRDCIIKVLAGALFSGLLVVLSMFLFG